MILEAEEETLVCALGKVGLPLEFDAKDIGALGSVGLFLKRGNIRMTESAATSVGVDSEKGISKDSVFADCVGTVSVVNFVDDVEVPFRLPFLPFLLLEVCTTKNPSAVSSLLEPLLASFLSVFNNWFINSSDCILDIIGSGLIYFLIQHSYTR